MSRQAWNTQTRRLLISLLGVVCITTITASNATRVFAHGEAADEPFLKNMTTAFFDVSISPTEIQVGDPVTIVGKVKVLETWPRTLEVPEIASIVPVVPGPMFLLKERTVNGESSIGSFFAEKGGIYEFRMVLIGKEPGDWHVHPGIGIQGTGTLLGPGEWIKISPSPTPLEFPVTLLNGETIELSTYGGAFAVWWSFASFVIGVVWMLYWTLNKRTVTNLAVTLQISPNDEGADLGLITPRDHMWMNVIAGVTLMMLVLGWSYAAISYPVRWPQQTDWFTPKFISSGDKMAEVQATGATFDEASETLEMKIQVQNVANSPISMKKYTMAMANFVNGGEQEQLAAGPREFVGAFEVSPDAPIAPGETKDLTVTISSPLFAVERLIPLSAPQQFIGGIYHFENAQGERELVTVRSGLVPTKFTPRYLP
jgi:methane/ammonia monooxygenase subunit B